MSMHVSSHSDSAIPTCSPPDPKPKKPVFVPPLGSVDSHCHIFGPSNVFAYAENRTFTPSDAPLEAFQELQKQLGFQRAVIVQSSCYAHNHEVLLNALKHGNGKYRGVGLVHPEMGSDEIERLDKAGVCGARLNFVSHLGKGPDPEAVSKIVSLIRPFGWHLSVHVSGNGLIDMADMIRKLDVPVVIDHIARVNIKEGVEGEAFQTLLRLLDKQNVWVKLSGVDRISATTYPFSDAVALAGTIAEHRPERIVWGTDWPHCNIKGDMPNDGELVDLIPEIAVSDATRQKMLIENPERLFGFEKRARSCHEQHKKSTNAY